MRVFLDVYIYDLTNAENRKILPIMILDEKNVKEGTYFDVIRQLMNLYSNYQVEKIIRQDTKEIIFNNKRLDEEMHRCVKCGWKGTDKEKNIRLDDPEINYRTYICPKCGCDEFYWEDSKVKRGLSDKFPLKKKIRLLIVIENIATRKREEKIFPLNYPFITPEIIHDIVYTHNSHGLSTKIVAIFNEESGELLYEPIFEN